MKTLPNETSALEWKPQRYNKKKSPSGGSLLQTLRKIGPKLKQCFASKSQPESIQSSSLPEESYQSGSGHIESGPLPENLFSGMMFLFLGASMSFLAVLMAREGAWICFPLSAIASLFLSRWWAAMSVKTANSGEAQ